MLVCISLHLASFPGLCVGVGVGGEPENRMVTSMLQV